MTAPFTPYASGSASYGATTPYDAYGQRQQQQQQRPQQPNQQSSQTTQSPQSGVQGQSQPGNQLTLATSPSATPYAQTSNTWGGSTTPGNYLNQTIAPGPGTDRIGLANQAWNTFANSTEPYYQRDLRSATQQAAGAGQLGSGQLRSSLGDVADNRNLQLSTAQQQLMNQAVTGSIADQYQNVGIAQQQQGFQAQQQQTAYSQALSRAQQQLSSTLGLGQLGVQQGQLSLAQTTQQQQNALAQGELTGQYNGQQTLGAQLGQGQLGVQQQQANTQQAGTLGNLALGQQQLGQQGSQFGQQFGLQQLQNQQQFGLQNQQLSLAQLQNQQQYGLAANAQNIQQGQFGQSLGQQLQLAQMGDVTANRGIDANLSLAQQEINLRAALSGYGGATPPGGAGGSSGTNYGGTAGGNTGGGTAGGSGNNGGSVVNPNANTTVNFNGQQYTPDQWQAFLQQNPMALASTSAQNAASNQQFFNQAGTAWQNAQLQRQAQATGQQLYPTLQNGKVVMMLGPASGQQQPQQPLAQTAYGANGASSPVLSLAMQHQMDALQQARQAFAAQGGDTTFANDRDGSQYNAWLEQNYPGILDPNSAYYANQQNQGGS